MGYQREAGSIVQADAGRSRMNVTGVRGWFERPPRKAPGRLRFERTAGPALNGHLKRRVRYGDG